MSRFVPVPSPTVGGTLAFFTRVASFKDVLYTQRHFTKKTKQRFVCSKAIARNAKGGFDSRSQPVQIMKEIPKQVDAHLDTDLSAKTSGAEAKLVHSKKKAPVVYLEKPYFRHLLTSTSSGSHNTTGYESIDETGDSNDHIISSILTSPKMITKHLDEYVIGQDRAKKILSVAVFNHYSRVKANLQQQIQNAHRFVVGGDQGYSSHSNNSQFWVNPSTNSSEFSRTIHDSEAKGFEVKRLPTFDKSNVLLLGPTGSGKTLLVRTLAKILKVPFSMSDATPFTQAGYVGEDVEVVIHRLLQNCNFDVKKAEQGIVFIDEIDKIAKKTGTLSMSKDVSGEGVQQALLRMLEGTVVNVTDKSSTPSHKNRFGLGIPGAGSKGEVYSVDTSNILFILSGAFIGLDKIIVDRVAKGSIGFGAVIRGSDQNDLTSSKKSMIPHSPNQHLLDLVDPIDLIKFGLIPEFVGRLPVVANVNQLDEASLVRILTEPKNSLVKQYEALFKLNDVHLKFTTSALYEIAKQAIKKQTGARGLRRIMEYLLLDSMYDTPRSSIKHVVVDSDSVLYKRGPLYFTHDQKNEVERVLEQDDRISYNLLTNEEEKLKHGIAFS